MRVEVNEEMSKWFIKRHSIAFWRFIAFLSLLPPLCPSGPCTDLQSIVIISWIRTHEIDRRCNIYEGGGEIRFLSPRKMMTGFDIDAPIKLEIFNYQRFSSMSFRLKLMLILFIFVGFVESFCILNVCQIGPNQRCSYESASTRKRKEKREEWNFLSKIEKLLCHLALTWRTFLWS